ncbi:SCO2522 family protein [Nocardia sp. NPDC051832]|uniref:SCO2522 family protein n=1 Tax=Nocardia sp. NPDC051832 TaxID=3155673 RepID=UPI0034162DC5
MENIAGYVEPTERPRIAEVPLSHVSIEVGHFFMADLAGGADRIRAQFRQVSRIVEAQIAIAKAEYGPAARVSTCFLADDYFRLRGRGLQERTRPSVIIPELLAAADEFGLTIAYLAREAGCWEVPATESRPVRIQLAEMVRKRIVHEPLPGMNGRRPPAVESGWLCNGRRESDHLSGQAMHSLDYRPPEELGRREHSIFLDVEMWSKRPPKSGTTPTGDEIKWSCPYLAAIWQLLRLGMLRYQGEPVVAPFCWQPDLVRPIHSGGATPMVQNWPAEWEDWWDMPAVVQLNPKAKPFAAYHSFSVLPQRHLRIEDAVRLIVEHVRLDDAVVDRIVERGRSEGVDIPRVVTDRMTHFIVSGF